MHVFVLICPFLEWSCLMQVFVLIYPKPMLLGHSLTFSFLEITNLKAHALAHINHC